MNDFKGLARDTSIVKTPEQMWQFARNILLSSKYLSITNEKGNEYGYSIPGVVIGFIISNDDIVYISVQGNYTCIGYVNYLSQSYTAVLRTSNPNFKFNLSAPVEGVYLYNYKKELIVVFSDGVKQESNTPKLINITNPQVVLTPAKEFIKPDDYLMFELFNHNTLPVTKYEYQTGALNAEVVHLSVAYVYNDNTTGLFSPVLETVYPNFKAENTLNRNVKFTLENLDTNFTKIKLAFVIKKEAGVFGYTSAILSIKNGSVVYTLSSEEDLVVVDPAKILIQGDRFTKIRTITKTANQIEIGNVEQRPITNWQKYANKLELTLGMLPTVAAGEQLKSSPTFLPDEVYSVRIVPIALDGTKYDAYHIPGRKATGTENALISDAELLAQGLNFDKYKNKGYKNFHILRTGGVDAQGAMKWGYWENEDTYPDKPYYNSLSIGGEDLRNTPVRYHKFPSLFDVLPNVYGGNKARVTGMVEPDLGYMPRFTISVKNFETVFPEEIKKLLQGYEVVIEKRSQGGTYIETNGFLYKTVLANDTKNKYEISENGQFENGTITWGTDKTEFTVSNFVSVETAKDRIKINADLVRCYYAIKQGMDIKDDSNPNALPSTHPPQMPTWAAGFDLLADVKEAKYLLANNIASNNRFTEERLQLKLAYLGPNDADDRFFPISSGNAQLNILYASLITLNKNIYNLENNNDFISVGIVKRNNTSKILSNGDVFVNNVIKKSFTAKGTGYTTLRSMALEVYSFVNYYLYNMYSPISNTYIVNGTSIPKQGRAIYIPFIGGDPSSNAITYVNWKNSDVNVLNSFDYSTIVKSKELKGYLNDYVGALPPALTENYVNYFPYRVYKGLAIPNESLQTDNLRFFPTNSYYEMRNDRGEIIALRGYNRSIYIQQKYTLSVSSIVDKLNAGGEETYLGSSELFDRIPEELIYSDQGYIGSNSQFACVVSKDGYVTIDEDKGKIFLINQQADEISAKYIKNSFEKILPLGNHYMKTDLLGKSVKVDNPYVSIGYVIGVDEETNRILVTKRYFEPKETTKDLVFDGEFYTDKAEQIIDVNNTYYFTNKCITYSYSLEGKAWVSPHDYFPNMYLRNNKGTYGIANTRKADAVFYKFNSDNVNPGNFFGKQYRSYVDLIFNTRLDINKQYQAISWVSEAVEIETERVVQFDTIDAVMVYNHHQCSGEVPVSKTGLTTARNAEGIWNLNEFRDMMLSPDNKVLDEDGNLIESSLSVKKQWYNKGIFIGNFLVTRLIWNNQSKRLIHIHNVQVKSITSNR